MYKRSNYEPCCYGARWRREVGSVFFCRRFAFVRTYTVLLKYTRSDISRRIGESDRKLKFGLVRTRSKVQASGIRTTRVERGERRAGSGSACRTACDSVSSVMTDEKKNEAILREVRFNTCGIA